MFEDCGIASVAYVTKGWLGSMRKGSGIGLVDEEHIGLIAQSGFVWELLGVFTCNVPKIASA